MKAIEPRENISKEDQWDLTYLFSDIKSWNTSYERIKGLLSTMSKYENNLSDLNVLKEALDNFFALSYEIDKLYSYASMRKDENIENTTFSEISSKANSLYADFSSQTSYVIPEIQSFSQELVDKVLKDVKYKDYHVFIDKVIYEKKHTLSTKEERILASESSFVSGFIKTFSILTNLEIDYGKTKVDGNEFKITPSSILSLLKNKDRSIREDSWLKFNQGVNNNKDSLSTLLSSSIAYDAFIAKVRGFNSSLESSLYWDKIDISIYDNLISEVNKALPSLHQYYDIRKEVLGVSELMPWDTSVDLVEDIKVNYPYDDAVNMIVESLKVLGNDYTSVLRKGLLSGWVDKYENKGKRSGAYSSGCYKAPPYILMNYKNDLLSSVTTLAHEAGHSMHTYYSDLNNPYPNHSYTIFEAEIASTFNEELLIHYLKNNTNDNKFKLFLLISQINNFVGTVFIQTLFAEFEKNIHRKYEENGALTTASIRSEYFNLLKKYNGKSLSIHELSDLTSIRVPHFYHSFYVYKYATGLAAAIKLSRKVLNGTQKDVDQYLHFLSSGGSLYPLESLSLAGVDMSDPSVISDTMIHFKNLIDEVKRLI